MANFNLSVGMNKEQVLQMAKNLSESTRAKVINFFNNDIDSLISNENELSILNSIFDGSGKVRMPGHFGLFPIGGTATSYTCEQKDNNGNTYNDTLVDRDGDGYADYHNMSYTEYTYRSENKKQYTFTRCSDNDFDGIPDKNSIKKDNYEDGIDEGGKYTIDKYGKWYLWNW